MMGTFNCVYETPCGWCSKWDKKCDKKSCFTCQHREYLSLKQIKCNAGKEIPKNMIFENCEKYKRKEESKLNTSLSSLFGSFCGF